MSNGEEWGPNKNKPEYQADDVSEEFIHIPYVSGSTSIEQDPPSHEKPSEVVVPNAKSCTLDCVVDVYLVLGRLMKLGLNNCDQLPL